MAKKKNPTSKAFALPVERIEKSILLVRDQKVMLDADLAELYEVSTGRLNEQVKRNAGRFPDDFAFQLTEEEFDSLMSQNAISNSPGRGGRRKLPWVFTEHGILMLSSVLRSERAVQINIQIMRAFVQLREMLATHKDLARKIEELERKHGEHDHNFTVVFETIRQLLEPPPAEKKRRIGFVVADNEE